MLSSILVAALVSAPGTAAQEAAPDFSGTWERDPGRSDDGEAKMRQAFERMQEERERRGRGAMEGPGPPRGRGPGRTGQVPPDELQLELEGGELSIEDGERLTIYYLDGEKHRREMPSGAKLETVAILQERTVLIEEKLDRGRIDRKLQLSEDGRTLVVTWTMKIENLKEPVVIRSVYDRVE